jgi:transcriptional regulator with XRE-family HTH domain
MSGTPSTRAMEYLGELCHLHRTLQHRSLQEVADMADTSKSYLWEIEHGQCAPSFVLVVRLCNVLGLDISALAINVLMLSELE